MVLFVFVIVAEATIGAHQGPHVVVKGGGSGGGGDALGGQRTVVCDRTAARVGCVAVGVEFGEFDHASIMEDPDPAIEDVAGYLDPGAGQATGRFPEPAVGLNDVIGRHFPGLANHEAAVEVGGVFGEAKGTSRLPALPGGVASQGLVGGVVVAVEEVAEAQREGARVRIDVGGAPSRDRST